MRIHITRKIDGRIAKLDELPEPADDEDMWNVIEKVFPVSYRLIDEHMVLPDDTDYEWDEEFCPADDKSLANWIVRYVYTYDGELADGASIHADKYDGYAAVTWTEDGREFVQYISLNPGNFEEIVLGADPVAEGWEDGCGKPVCRANATGGPVYIVVDQDTETLNEWISREPTEEDARRQAMAEWDHLTWRERKHTHVQALTLEGDPDDFEDDYNEHVEKYIWDSDEDAEEEECRCRARSVTTSTAGTR